MDNSIYLTLSRQLMLLRDLDTTSNNMANVNTTGYQANHTLFTSYLVKDDGRGNMAFAHDVSTYRNMEPGTLTTTGNTFDVAISGEGYFVVQTPAGQRYTRAGNFKIDSAGTLVTAEGYTVMDPGGQQIRFNPEDKDITIGGAGNISINGQERGQLDIVSFENPYELQRVGNRLYTSGQTPQPATDARVVQGALEVANVQPVVEMTHLLNVTRGVEDSAKIIQIVYDLESRAGQAWTQS